MTRPILDRLHRAGPWFCSTAILLFVALSPVIFVTAGGDEWLLPWILAGVPVVALTLWLTAMAYDSGQAPVPTPGESVETVAETVEIDDESAEVGDETTLSSPISEDSAPTTADSIPTTADSAPTSTDSAESGGRGGEAGMRVAVLSLSRKVQASAHRIQEESTRMVAKFPAEPDVLEAGMRVDHAAAQQARLAQSIATLCGEQPGQHWRDPLPIADVVRGAAGRITAYRRVRVEGDPPVAVQGAYVEPLIHLVAELLANATQSSPPATEVLVTIRSVRRGAALEIDDAGVGMDETNLAWMREIASGTRQVRLQDLGEIPQTGLAVVGTYVRRHGFRVDLTESVHGGLRVAVLVPEAMITPMSVDVPEQVAPPAPAPAAIPPQQQHQPSSFTSDGLPQRRSKRGERPTTGQQRAEGSQVVAPRSEPTAEQAGAWMSSFLSTVAETDPAPESHWRRP
ncbi:ATP-binding protein [Nocardioides sp. NPDC006273]|uniref:ATP-binding protein n=1 Tax=Nocardioides sp. NPDC006273 TaxID=3155598 RepID=UPI0033BF1C8C